MSIEVKFNYESDDRETGIPGGWGECYVTDGEDITFFRPDEDKPPAEWRLEDEDGDDIIVTDDNKTGYIERVKHLSSAFRKAIERKWNLMQAEEALAEADMACGALGGEIGELQSAIRDYRVMIERYPDDGRYVEFLARTEGELKQIESEFTKLDDERDMAETRLRELREEGTL